MAGALVLASASPQRRAILEQLQIAFEVRPADVEELAEGEPGAVVAHNAALKATAQWLPGETVLGVDTIVAVDGRVFGKPADAAGAERMLAELAGRSHEVLSGVAVAHEGRVRDEVVRTRVTFAPLEAAEIAAYVGTGEWRGRAGGYAIQGRGAWLVERIDGEYLNVVGLPVGPLRRLLPRP